MPIQVFAGDNDFNQFAIVFYEAGGITLSDAVGKMNWIILQKTL
jgi:hypothetical protein